jgi:flagellar capping protein FliD
MLSSVLNATRAVQVNIAIMRTFVQLRRLMDNNRDLARRIDSLEARYDEQFSAIFDAIKQLIADEGRRKSKPPIGFL